MVGDPHVSVTVSTVGHYSLEVIGLGFTFGS